MTASGTCCIACDWTDQKRELDGLELVAIISSLVSVVSQNFLFFHFLFFLGIDKSALLHLKFATMALISCYAL